jgi:FkbM family methyltransferase
MIDTLRRFIYRRGKSTLAQLFDKPVSVYGIQYDIFHDSVGQPYRDLILYERYEKNEIDLIEKHIDPTTPVIELGAGLGVVSCVISSIAHGTDHIAVEPSSESVEVLQHQREINNMQFDIVNACYHPTKRNVEFDVSDKLTRRKVSSDNSSPTKPKEALSLEVLANSFKQPRFNLVCDIEGMEWKLIDQEDSILSGRCNRMVVEIHPNEVSADKVMSKMNKIGFKKSDNLGDVYAFVSDDS